jgi:hypothetical protein
MTSGMKNPALVSLSHRPGCPAIVTISPEASVFHLAGKSPIASSVKSSTATIRSPGTKSNLL